MDKMESVVMTLFGCLICYFESMVEELSKRKSEDRGVTRQIEILDAKGDGGRRCIDSFVIIPGHPRSCLLYFWFRYTLCLFPLK